MTGQGVHSLMQIRFPSKAAGMRFHESLPHGFFVNLQPSYVAKIEEPVQMQCAQHPTQRVWVIPLTVINPGGAVLSLDAGKRVTGLDAAVDLARISSTPLPKCAEVFSNDGAAEIAHKALAESLQHVWTVQVHAGGRGVAACVQACGSQHQEVS
jgi:hypothetical protein